MSKKNNFAEKLKDKDFVTNMVLIILLTIVVAYIVSTRLPKPKEITHNEFLQLIENKKIESVYINPKKEKFEFVDNTGKKFTSANPQTDNFREFLLLNDVEVTIDKTGKGVLLALETLKYAFLVSFLFIMVKKMGIDAIAKRENLVTEIPKTTFKDIAGNEEAKQDMQYLVEFLKSPEKYTKIGAKLPKGVVLYGPPGTGKTLTARAIAGEAGVPFFNTSGSDFIELYAGLGAKRVRDLFAEARDNSPCIVFIDEIDAIGTHRETGENSGEKNQTINALLAELDGFDNEIPIITIVATNIVDDLDRALIRPGRFDKHIAIELPEAKDRLSILNVYAKNKQLADDVDLPTLSKMTLGYSGAALEALMNEAAIIAVNKNSEQVRMEDINDAYFKMTLGGHKKINSNRDYEEIELVAYHEAGHALLTKLLTDNEVPKVTIIPSTNGVGGVTFSIPKEKGLMTKKELLNGIKCLYGGRAAEELLRGKDNVTNGASNDIKVASGHIKRYYEDYGMSEFGMLNIKEKEYRESAKNLSENLYIETFNLLKDNKDILDNIAKTLIDKETISEIELDKLINQ